MQTYEAGGTGSIVIISLPAHCRHTHTTTVTLTTSSAVSPTTLIEDGGGSGGGEMVGRVRLDEKGGVRMRRAGVQV